MEYTTYKTTGGENWHLLSYRAYGSLTVFIDGVERNGMELIADANPEAKISPVLPAGLTLRIPCLVTAQSAVDISRMPFWKQ